MNLTYSMKKHDDSVAQPRADDTRHSALPRAVSFPSRYIEEAARLKERQRKREKERAENSANEPLFAILRFR